MNTLEQKKKELIEEVELSESERRILQDKKTEILVNWAYIKKQKANYPKGAYKAFQSTAAKQLVDIEMALIS